MEMDNNIYILLCNCSSVNLLSLNVFSYKDIEPGVRLHIKYGLGISFNEKFLIVVPFPLTLIVFLFL